MVVKLKQALESWQTFTPFTGARFISDSVLQPIARR